MPRLERADQELSLRGRPLDLAPIQVQLLPAPQARKMRPALSRRAVLAVSRHRRTAGLWVLGGLAAGMAATYFEQPGYTATAVSSRGGEVNGSRLRGMDWTSISRREKRLLISSSTG